MTRRCVITGMGAVTPLGSTVASFWDGIKNGVCGIDIITRFDTTDFKVKIAAQVKGFDALEYMSKKDIKRNDLYSIYAMAAAAQAVGDSDLKITDDNALRTGVIVGSGIGGLITMQEQVIRLNEKGPSRVSPLFIPMTIGNMAAGNIALQYGAKGECENIVTACSTSTHSIGAAFRNIKHGYLDACIAGGTEACICEIGIAGFTNLTALSVNEDPLKACRPFDKERDGFVMGEGAGILILEELEHALARGAHIYGEITGFGSTCDAYHMTAPSPDGLGAANAMKLAIEESGIKPSDISYINAHGTSTHANEAAETKAIKLAFGEDAYKIPISSTKSMTGHLLGAAGAIESIVCLKALEEGFLPPTINYHNPDEECDLDYIPNVGRKAENAKYALSNTFGFGGHNGVLCFKKWEGVK